jgi:hypothetical protein
MISVLKSKMKMSQTLEAWPEKIIPIKNNSIFTKGKIDFHQ